MLVNGNRSIVLSRVLCGLLAGVMVVFTAANAFAQAPAATARYKSVRPKMTERESKNLRTRVQNALNNAAAFEGDGKKVIDSYFKGYFFRQLTQYSPTPLSKLSKSREELFKKYLRAAKHTGAQQYLTNITLSFFRVIARDNYHPAVRYNAALILGKLSTKYSTGGSNPQPLADGAKELLSLLEQNEFNGVRVHPSVKVAALEGLQRHVRFGLDPQYADRVTKAAMAMLTQEPTVLGVNEEVNHWIRCQAAQVLVSQFQAAPTAELHAALTKLIADEKMGLDDRCLIAASLKQLKYAAAINADLTSTVLPLGILAQAVVSEGAEKAQKYEEEVFGTGAGGGGRRRSFGGGRRGSGEEEGPKLERRQLLSRLISISAGSKSLSTALPAESKEKLANLTRLLDEAIAVSGAKDSVDLKVMNEILQLKGSVDILVNSWKPASAVEAAEEEVLGE